MVDESIINGLLHTHLIITQHLPKLFQDIDPSIQERYIWDEETERVWKILGQALGELGRLINKLKITQTPKTSFQITDLVKFADWLDENGFYALANKIDVSVGLVKTAEEYGYCPQVGKVKENSMPVQPPQDGALSTRYCPDHIGVQAVRIDDNTIQCPLDGKEYNYETGYANYEGQIVPGGSVAAQTPMESDFGGIPMRFYDSRSDVLNRIT